MSKTALELTPEELKCYNPARNLGKNRDDARWKRAWSLVPELAALLRKDFGATRIVVFGSLTQKERYTRWSDIDLAVWGILPEKFYQALGTLNEFGEEFKVDLVDPTSNFCRSSVQQTIEQEGIEI